MSSDTAITPEPIEIVAIESMSLFERLAHVQCELNVPKSQYNSFGKFYYRNAEDIENAAKPLCLKYGLCLTVDEHRKSIGDCVYVNATATVHDIFTGLEHSCSSQSREPIVKKGMDECQVSGTASSYAVKRALGNIFCVDDTKDSDSFEPETESRYKAPIDSKATKEPKKAESKPQKKPRADTEALDAAIARAKAAVTAFAEKEGIDPVDEWKMMQSRPDCDRKAEAWWVDRAIEYEAR